MPLRLAALALFAASLHAGTVTITWLAPTTGPVWQSARVYEIVGADYVKVAEVPGDQMSATLANVVPGVHSYVVRAVAGWESPDSDVVKTPPPPGAPKISSTTVTTVTVETVVTAK